MMLTFAAAFGAGLFAGWVATTIANAAGLGAARTEIASLRQQVAHLHNLAERYAEDRRDLQRQVATLSGAFPVQGGSNGA